LNAEKHALGVNAPASSLQVIISNFPICAAQVNEVQLKDAERELLRLGARNADDKEALKAEWSRLELGSIPAAMAKHLPTLTARTEAGNGAPGLAPVEQRRNWWKRAGAGCFPLTAKVAVRLLGMHVTTCASERDWSYWGNVYVKARSRLAISKGEKIVFIKGNVHMLDASAAAAAPPPDAQLVLEVLEGSEVDEGSEGSEGGQDGDENEGEEEAAALAG
jgi:hypothetical protein